MSRIEREFSVSEPCRVAVSLASAEVAIIEGNAGTIGVVVEGNDRAVEFVEVEQEGDTVSVRLQKGERRWNVRKVAVRISVPAGAAVSVRTASGDLRVTVPVSDAEIDTASSDVRLAGFDGLCRIKTASGDVVVGASSGGMRVMSASGDLRLDGFRGDLSVSTASGDVVLGEVEGMIAVRTASGDVDVRRFSGTRLEASSMSGDVTVGLASGMVIDADVQTLSGSFRNRVSPSSAERSTSAELKIKTLSGDVTLR